MIDWDAIVGQHSTAVWRTAYRLLGNRADADECFQETFASALTLVQRPHEPVRQWGALLVRLATLRAVDRLRSRIRRTTHEDPGADTGNLLDQRTADRPPQRAEDAEFSERLRKVIAHLPPKQAGAFCLHCLEGWSYREVAAHLVISTDEVGTLIHRARAALRERIGSVLSTEALSAGSRFNPEVRSSTREERP